MPRSNATQRKRWTQADLPPEIHHLAYVRRWRASLFRFARGEYDSHGRGVVWLEDGQTRSGEWSTPVYRAEGSKQILKVGGFISGCLSRVVSRYDPEHTFAIAVRCRGGLWCSIELGREPT